MEKGAWFFSEMLQTARSLRLGKPFLVDSKGHFFPKHEDCFIGKPGKQFFICVAVQSLGSPCALQVRVDGVQLDAAQPVESGAIRTVVFPGFPEWKKGVCADRAFVFASAKDGNTVGSGVSSVGLIEIEAFFVEFFEEPLPSYSSKSACAQVGLRVDLQEDRKFFVDPALSTCPGDLLPGAGARMMRTIRRVPGDTFCVTAELRYDSFEHLNLRNELTAEQYAELQQKAEAAQPPKNFVAFLKRITTGKYEEEKKEEEQAEYAVPEGFIPTKRTRAALEKKRLLQEEQAQKRSRQGEQEEEQEEKNL